MNLPLQIAKRYLFAKKSHHAINIVSWISVCGVSIATMAMVCTLSVFNGFQDLFSALFCSFDPQLKITPIEGKVFSPNTPSFKELKNWEEIAVFTEVIEENALLRYNDKQVPATLKGVSTNFQQLTSIDSILLDGEFKLSDDVTDYATIGVGLASILNTGLSPIDPIEVCVPKRNAQISMINPAASLENRFIFISAIFSIEQPEYDEKYLIVPIDFARKLYKYQEEVSAIELKLHDNISTEQTKKKIKQLLGNQFKVENQYEQQAEFFKIMNVEKWIAFLILCFIMLIATFNIIASLSMLIIDKREDIMTLRNLGADNQFIVKIFLLEGRIISAGGAIVGILLGIILCWLQQEFGLLRLGGGNNQFIVDAYPVQLRWSDIIFIFVAVISIGFLAVWYPIHYMGNKWIKDNKF